MEIYTENFTKNLLKIKSALYGLLLFLLFFIPFQFSLGSFLGFDLHVIRILSLFIFIFWLFISFIEKKVIIPTNPVFVSFIIFIFLSFLSLFHANNPIWGLRKAVFILNFSPFLLIPIILIASKKSLFLVLKSLTWGAFLAAVVGILQFSFQFIYGFENVYHFWSSFIAPFFLGNNFSEAVLSNPSWLVNISGQTFLRATSFFPDPHIASFYFGMSTPISLALYWKLRSGRYLIFFITLVLANLLTFSRGGYLAIITALLIAILFILNKTFSNKKQSLKKFWLGLFFSLLILLSFLFSPIGTRLISSFNPNEGSNAERLSIWNQSLKISLQNPLGLGLGNFPLEVNPLASYRDPIYSHNLYLDILVELGFFGLFCFLLILFFAFIGMLKKASFDKLFYFPVFSILIFSIHSFFDTSLFSVHILPLLLVLLAISGLKLNYENY